METETTDNNPLASYRPTRTYSFPEWWTERRIEHAATREELTARLKGQPPATQIATRWRRHRPIRPTDHGFEMTIARRVFSDPIHRDDDPAIASLIRKYAGVRYTYESERARELGILPDL